MQWGEIGNGKKSPKRNMKRKEKGGKRDGKMKGWKQGKEKLHMRRKSKVVEKSEYPLYIHGLGLLNTKELQPQVK